MVRPASRSAWARAASRERIFGADRNRQPVRQGGEQRARAFAVEVGIVGVGEHARPRDGDRARIAERLDGDRRDRPGRLADRRDDAERPQGGKRAREGLAADPVDRELDALAVGDAAHRLDPARIAVEEDRLGAGGARDLGLGGRADRADDPQTPDRRAQRVTSWPTPPAAAWTSTQSPGSGSRPDAAADGR